MIMAPEKLITIVMEMSVMVKIMAMVIMTGDIDGNWNCATDSYKSHGC